MASVSLDQPLVLLVANYGIVKELRSEDCPLYFGENIDPVTGIDRELLDAVRFAAHPVDLLRRLGAWADKVQCSVPPGHVATCWHPAVTPEVLRQASRYPVHVLKVDGVGDARALVRTLCGEPPTWSKPTVVSRPA